MRILLPLVYYVFFPLGKGKQLNSAKAKWSLLNSGGAIISKTEHRILYCCDEPLSYVRQIFHSGWDGLGNFILIKIVILKLLAKMSIASSIVVMNHLLRYMRQIHHNG